MWKRIQTLYLLISTGLIVSMLFSRFASIIGPGGEEAIIRYHEKMPYLVLLLMLTTSHIAATASFKTRFLQARVSIIAALLAIGFQIWLGVDFLRFRTDMVFSISAIFPIVAAILNILAARGALVEGMTLQTAERVLKSKKKRR
jgi:hypothetical protein